MKKKIIIILSVVLIALLGIGFLIKQLSSTTYVSPVIASLPNCDSSDCYYSDGFQDYTDYCKYYYDKQDSILDELKNSQYFKIIKSDDVAEINSYFDNFEGWLEYVDYKDKYDLQRKIIDTEDYFYIENNETSEKYAGYSDKYSSYNVYFFDVQTKTLYFIHNNIWFLALTLHELR